MVASAAASILRPLVLLPLLRRAGDAVLHPPDRPWPRAARAVGAIAVGVLAIADPLTVLEVVVVSAGLLLVVAGASELLRLAGGPVGPRVRVRHVGRSARIVALAVTLVAGLAVAAFAVAGDPEPVQVGRCNGQAALCDRTLDQVAFVGTHNSMAADGEPGWLFAAQDAGIDAQLDEGVRALLIDTHYGFATPRGVATDLARASKSREKIESEVGERFVETAERLRTRIGYTGGGTREVFLCHAFCEVGATPALEALEGVHRFLVAHPEEVLILSIEDDTDAADTAQLIRRQRADPRGLPRAGEPPWPTLRELIDRDERVLVLAENDAAAAPWMHEQTEVAQETPYRFNSAAELAAPTTLRAQPRRHGGLAAAGQPLGRHLARAAHDDRPRGQRPGLPRSPAGALPRGAPHGDEHRRRRLLSPGKRVRHRGGPMSDPITAVLESILHECAAAAPEGALADYIPELARADRDLFGIVLESHRGRRVRRRRRDRRVHDPVDLQAVRVRAGAGGPRARRGRRARRRRAERRAVQRDQPRAGHRPPRQPDDQRGGDPDHLAGRRRPSSGSRTACSAFAGRPLDVDEAVYESERAPATATARSRT